MTGIILVDKPQEYTSHDVVAKLRGILREKRIGHSGTLDPLATGLLVIFVGRATRAVEFAENNEKEYIAGLRPGIVTDTQDITGNILNISKLCTNIKEIEDVLHEFKGEIEQTPPMYSAVKINGKKLYDLARNGIEVDRQKRRINIKELELIGKSDEDFILRIVCSKGTYIRTLCYDIGQRIGTGATLSCLRRLRAGNFSVDNAYTIDEIKQIYENGRINEILLPIDSMFSEFPQITLTENQKKKCLCGNSFATGNAADGKYRVYAEDGSFLMLGCVENGVLYTIKSFFEV